MVQGLLFYASISASADVPALGFFADTDKLLIAAGLEDQLGMSTFFHHTAIVHHKDLAGT